MATKIKTRYTDLDVKEFINAFVEKKQKKSDSFQLIELMGQWTGFEPRMWGPTIIGFETYHYRYASGHEGDAPLIGFSPRKPAITLYVTSSAPHQDTLLEKLGKYKISKACIYIRKLSDIDISVLEKLCKMTIDYIRDQYKHAH